VKEFVVGLDGSEESRRALRWAVSVADLAKAPVRAVQAWSYAPSAVLPGAAPMVSREEMDERTEADLRDIVATTLGDVPENVRMEALRGPAAAAILDRVSPDGVLVLGTRGRGGFVGMILGSVSRACLEHASCPVVIVRDDRPPQGTAEAIVVGKDGSVGAVQALEWATSLAKLTGAAVAAVYAWQPQASEVNPSLHRRLRTEAQSTVDDWISHHTALGSIELEGDPRDKLVELAQRTDARLIVIGRRGTSRLTGIVLGGVTNYLVSNSPTTVAVIPPIAENSS
jgi:nucleotide-binding universal stress UspA family protein